MLDRLNAAMAHLEKHLGGKVDVAALAHIAHTSEYHFRRMFSTLAGIPLSEYVRRRRLTLAAGRVVAGNEGLLDIAISCGYTSSEAFARAFRALHGVGPAEARRGGATFRSQPRMTFHLTIEGATMLDHRIVERDTTRIIGYSTTVPIVHLGENDAIAEFTRSIDEAENARLLELSNVEPSGIVAAVETLDESWEEGARVHYAHGVVSTAQAPQGLETWQVPAGTWAVFSGSGEAPESVQYVWRDVYTEWFPSNPYRSAPGPTILRSELSTDGGWMDYELWVPVEYEAWDCAGEQ